MANNLNHNHIISPFTSLLAKVLHELDQQSEEMRKALRSPRFLTVFGIIMVFFLMIVITITFLCPRFWVWFSENTKHLWIFSLPFMQILFFLICVFLAMMLFLVPFGFLHKNMRMRLILVAIQAFFIAPFWFSFLATLLDWVVNPEFVFTLSGFATGYLSLLQLLIILLIIAIPLFIIFTGSPYLLRWMILMLSTSSLPKIETESETSASSSPSRQWLSHDELTARVIEKAQVECQNWSEAMRKAAKEITEQRVNFLNSQIQTASFILVTLTLFGLVPVIFPDGVNKIFQYIALFLNQFSSSPASIESIQSFMAILVFAVIIFGLRYFSRAYKTIRALEIIQIMLTAQESITNQPVPAPAPLPTPTASSPDAQPTTWTSLTALLGLGLGLGLGLLCWLIRPKVK